MCIRPLHFYYTDPIKGQGNLAGRGGGIFMDFSGSSQGSFSFAFSLHVFCTVFTILRPPFIDSKLPYIAPAPSLQFCACALLTILNLPYNCTSLTLNLMKEILN